MSSNIPSIKTGVCQGKGLYDKLVLFEIDALKISEICNDASCYQNDMEKVMSDYQKLLRKRFFA